VAKSLPSRNGQRGLVKFWPVGQLYGKKVRCVYENEDVLVTHAFSTFQNGTVDEVLWVGRKKDGLIHRVETGSTPISQG
jgi:hypothetical protein